MEMNPKRNAEHYPDPTAYQAIRNAEPARFPFRPVVYVCSPYAGDVEPIRPGRGGTAAM